MSDNINPQENLTHEAEAESFTDELIGLYQQEIEALNQRVSAAEQAVHQAQLERWRVEAAAREGLPPELADRLQGEDAGSIVTDAKRLAKLFPVRKQTRTGHASQSIAPTRARQIFDRIEGRQGNPFDILLQKSHGGGAFEE
ncbi:MAG: hypothetical protein L0154_10030 [Chloroflexi bacterium]|nr:hypothetical protein [Chloroflexota bacterium]